jgi:hypothetical protein
MADHVQTFEELAGKLERMEVPKAVELRAGAKIDICAIWKTIKPFIELGIKALKLLPFKWAQKLADALQLLDNAMNSFCPA